MKDLPHISSKKISARKVEIPREKGKSGLIIFDLDETLIHCVGTKDECEGIIVSTYVDLKFPGEDVITAGVNIRPGVLECLKRLGKHF